MFGLPTPMDDLVGVVLPIPQGDSFGWEGKWGRKKEGFDSNPLVRAVGDSIHPLNGQ